MTSRSGVPGNRLQLDELDERSWRLCDSRVARSDARYVVAYIEAVSSGFSVVWLHGIVGRSHFPDLKGLLDFAAQAIVGTETHGATRPIPIPHFAPKHPGRA